MAAKKLTEPTKSSKKNKISTLAFLEINEIRDGILILREGQMRSVIAVSSANFNLKSGIEQEQIINQFQGVLNSLEFPIQILIQSRKLNLDRYLNKLRILEDQQENDLLRVKMQEYIEYVQTLLDERNIMSKEFYIICGFEPVSLKSGVFGRFLRALNPTQITKQKQEEFLMNKKTLLNQAESIASRFSGLDLKVNFLNTEQLIALMYNCYNPDTLESIRISDTANLDIE
jgi:hypothetical protein